MHDTQLVILNTLRIHKSLKREVLMRITGLTANDVSSHVKKLKEPGYIDYNNTGYYHITPQGLAFMRTYLQHIVETLIDTETPAGDTTSLKERS